MRQTSLSNISRAVALLLVCVQLLACSSKAANTPIEPGVAYRSGDIEVALPQGWALFEDEWLVPNHRLITLEVGDVGSVLIHHYLPQGEDGVEVPDLNALKREFLETWVFHPDGYGAVRAGDKAVQSPFMGEFIVIEPVPERKAHERFEFFSLSAGDTHAFIALDLPSTIRQDQKDKVEAFLASVRVRGHGLETDP